jgi:hypothetical protein
MKRKENSFTFVIMAAKNRKKKERKICIKLMMVVLACLFICSDDVFPFLPMSLIFSKALSYQYILPTIT